MVEKLRGEPLDAVVHDRITAPLGMKDTGYNPADKARTAATEYQTAPPRGMVRGEVHDENAWSLGGVAGHAGVFSTVDDLAVLSQALLNGGTYRGAAASSAARASSRSSRTSTATSPATRTGSASSSTSAGTWTPSPGPRTAGHTGYTGTSIVIDFTSRSFAILLTNRVHPSRSWGSINIARREWAHGLAASMGIRPRHGDTAWFTGSDNATTTTLTTPALPVGAGGGAPRLRPLPRHRGDRPAAPRALHRRRRDVDGPAVRRRRPGRDRDRRRRRLRRRHAALGAGAGRPPGRVAAAALAPHDRRRLPRSGRRRRRRRRARPRRRPARRREDTRRLHGGRVAARRAATP